jgi:hypothetical protein
VANIAGVLAAMLAWKGKQAEKKPAESDNKPPKAQTDDQSSNAR